MCVVNQPLEMHPVLIFLLLTGILPISKLAPPSIEIPASFKPIQISGSDLFIEEVVFNVNRNTSGVQVAPMFNHHSTDSDAIPNRNHPVKEPIPMSTGIRPVLREAPN